MVWIVSMRYEDAMDIAAAAGYSCAWTDGMLPVADFMIRSCKSKILEHMEQGTRRRRA
jgi:hypothetical protein